MTLYEAGKDAMEKEFRNLLARHGRPVPPGSLLDVLALEHGTSVHGLILVWKVTVKCFCVRVAAANSLLPVCCRRLKMHDLFSDIFADN